MYGIYSIRFWLLVCAFIVSRVVALASPCAKIYTYSWEHANGGTYSVKMDAVIQVSWDATNRNLKFTSQINGYCKNSNGVWVASNATVELQGAAFNGHATVGGSPIYGGSYALVPGVRTVILDAGYQPTFIARVSATDIFGTPKLSGWNYEVDLSSFTQAASASPNPLVISMRAPGVVNFAGAVEDGRASPWEVQVISGPVTVSIDQANDKATITGTAPGIAHLRVRATPGECAPASEWFPFDVEVTGTYCTTIKLDFGTEGTTAPYYFKASFVDPTTNDPAQLLTEWVIPAGTKGAYLKSFGPYDNPGAIYIHQLKYIVHVYDEKTGSWWKPALGFVNVPNDWSFVGSAALENCQGTITPKPIEEAAPTPGKPNPNDPNGPPIPADQTPTNGPTSPSTDSSGGTVTGPLWSSPPSDGVLTDGVYKEGVNSIVSELRALNDKSGIWGGSDPIRSAISDAYGSGAGSTDGNGNGNGSGQAADQVAEAMDEGPQLPQVSLPSGSGAGLAIAGAYGVNINLDPASSTLISSLAGFLKQFITWVAGLSFAWWCWGEFDRVVRDLIHSQQAKGNALIGGTGAQATALVAAAAITGILILVPLAFWAIASYDITPVTSASGPASIALYLLFFFIPVPFLLSLIFSAFVVRKAALVLVASTATLIRFIVP
jgi:hypothetical protein